MSSKNFYGLTGDVTIDGGILNVGNAQLYANTETSNVGIGTTNPGFTLDVNGDANVGVLYSTFLHGDGSNIENIVSSQWEGSPGNPIYYTSNVGISNTEVVTKTLQIGSNLFVEETGSNVLYVTGNVYASRFVGDGSLLTGIAASLDDIVDQGNVVSNTIILESGIDPVSNIGLVTKEGVAISISNVNPTGEFQLGVGSNLLVNVYSSNVLTVDGNIFAQKMTLGTVTVIPAYNLEQITGQGAVSVQTMSLTNATTGLTTTANIVVGGNVTATSVIITSNIEVGGNVNANTVITTANIEVGGNVNANTVITTANIEVGGNAQLQGGVALGGHIIPTVDSAYDIGSAAFKIRDMYVSDNSLWIGDDTKLSVTGGELKFRKRNTGVVPKGITDMGGTSGAALTHAGVSDINDMKLHHWESYAKSVDATKTTKDIFTDDAENYETSAIKTFNTSNAMTIGTTKTFAAVCTADASGANKYYIDGYLQASLVLHQGQTYIFDLSSPTLVDHPFVFQTTNANDGTTDGTNYTSGITTTGGYGSTEKRTFVVPVGAPTTLYYYCTAHSGMGGSVSISSEAELIVSGGAEFLGTGTIKLPSGTTDQRPATGINGMLRYNSQTGYMEAYTASGWGSIATPPTIQTISPVSVAVADVTTQVFTVTGAFFDAKTTIQLQGADNTLYDVTDFTFTNSGSIGFKMGTLASGQAANRPYKLVVTNGAGLSATSTATIRFTGLSWTSPAAGATLATFLTYVSANNTELAATDDIGGTNRTFSVPANNLPSPLTLNGSTGAITGTIGAAGTTSVTFRVTDNVSGSTLDRTFNIVGETPLYAFSSFTFNTGGLTGRTGPSLTQLRNTYGTSGGNAWIVQGSPHYLRVVTTGIQEWTVPMSGTYRITAAGAYGYNYSGDTHSGYGAIMRGDVTLAVNSTLRILVGQKTIYNGGSYLQTWSAGGGGTYVAYSNNNPLIVAGGGGNVRGPATPTSAQRAIMNANTGTSGNGPVGGPSNGGIDGDAADPNNYSNRIGGGGAGFYTNGAAPTGDTRYGSGYTGSKSFLNGGVGATFTGETGAANGGFGGGGPAGWGGAGGGGGYSGGGDCNNRSGLPSGGGGSFISSDMTNAATSDGTFSITGNEPTTAYSGTVTNIGSYNGISNNGYVIITKI